MPGVNFTRKSAGRIADTVRGFERQALPDNKLQRRRAGGLGRMTLWEVTAVQTGPKTVTIKRVSNIAFDLNALSEKEDILYDPDNEPSAGDRGLLIRLGNGSLFFFKRAAFPVIEATDYRYVDENQPDTNFGNSTRSISFVQDTAVGEKIGIMKFERQILPGDPAFSIILLREIMNYAPAVLTDNVAGVAESAEFFMDIYKITNDFTPSAVTWNNYSGLSLTLIGGGPGASLGNISGIVDIGSPSDSAGGNYSIPSAGVEFALTNGQSYSWDFSNAYGMSLRLRGADFQGTPKAWSCTLRLEINLEKTLLIPGLPT